jgi:hypothetical protein
MEGDEVPVVVGLDGFGEQSVERERLVLAARHQAFDGVAALKAVASDLLHGNAPDDHRIEAVEGAKQAPDQPSALGRISIEVGQVGEIGGYRRTAMHGDGMAFFRPCELTAQHCRKRQCNHRTDDSKATYTPKSQHGCARI